MANKAQHNDIYKYLYNYFFKGNEIIDSDSLYDSIIKSLITPVNTLVENKKISLNEFSKISNMCWNVASLTIDSISKCPYIKIELTN